MNSEVYRRLMDSGIIPLIGIFLGSYSVILCKSNKLENRIKKLKNRMNSKK